MLYFIHTYIYKSKRGGAGWLKRITEESGFDVWLDLRWTRTRTDSTRNSKSLWTPASSPLLFDRNFRDGGGRRPFVTRRPIVRRRCVFSNFKDVRFVIRETNFPVSRHPRNRRRSYENSLHPKKKGEREDLSSISTRDVLEVHELSPPRGSALSPESFKVSRRCLGFTEFRFSPRSDRVFPASRAGIVNSGSLAGKNFIFFLICQDIDGGWNWRGIG